MNSCNTDIFFSNSYHLHSVGFEFLIKCNPYIDSSVSPVGQDLQLKWLFPGASLRWTKVPFGHRLQLSFIKAKLSE